MSRETVKLIEFNENHVVRAAELYLEAMPGDFICQFDTELLKLMNMEVCNSSDSFGYTFEENGLVGGYIVCSMDSSSLFTSVVKNNRRKFYMMMLKKVLRSPRFILKLFKTRGVVEEIKNETVRGELVTAALDPSFRGRGIGKTLYLYAVERFKVDGASAVRATIHAEDPVINNLYLSLGFEEIRSYDFGNSNRKVMEIHFNDPKHMEKFNENVKKYNIRL